ncbi:DUF1127 domain-containing protein [Devosia sp. SL43]|uniref:DUF1127 domain-containing protein n=1 Tax=Devosia sp. SL43 TaxID=2806348 RepID=UPI001F27E78E|nr:DUF1127 domain-containing protein [Devosia sp. SL43]UJW86898.1 DUF1127 domain-containing protein [Devosia sp. SL43]
MFSTLFHKYKSWRGQRRAIHILREFDDHRLDDVGARRDNIELFVARNGNLY